MKSTELKLLIEALRFLREQSILADKRLTNMENYMVETRKKTVSSIHESNDFHKLEMKMKKTVADYRKYNEKLRVLIGNFDVPKPEPFTASEDLAKQNEMYEQDNYTTGPNQGDLIKYQEQLRLIQEKYNSAD
jgi:hypothetical protein